MADLLNDGFEGGEAGLLNDYVQSIYNCSPDNLPCPRLHVSTAWAHHGIYSIIYHSSDNFQRDFANPNPANDVYFWGYIYFDPIVNPGQFNANGIGIWELRHSSSPNYPDYVNLVLEALTTNGGANYYWNFLSFHMDSPHRLGTRIVVPDTIVSGHAYKLVTSYSHYLVSGTPWQTLKIWVDDVLKGTITEAKMDNVDQSANSIFLGSPKAEYNGGLISGVYLDCIGIGYNYPVVDYFAGTTTHNLGINSLPINLGQFEIEKL
jgi:hypothetical protein